MAHVVVLTNPLDASRRHLYDVPAGTPLLEWLDTHEPNGGRLHRTVTAGGREITDPAYRIAPGDAVLVTFAPGSGPQIAYFIAQAVISFAIGYTLNKLFGPSKPKAGETPSPSQVYGLGQARNAARLGQPIPVVYGSVITVPDFAAQPFTEYVNNDQILYALLCIGQGQHDVTELLLGDSSAQQLDSTVVTWKVYQPADHRSTFGVIENDTNTGDGGVRENVVSSASVADQELLAPNTGTPVIPSTYYWYPLDFDTTKTKPSTPPAIDMLGATTTGARLALLPVNPTLGTTILCIMNYVDGWYYFTLYQAVAYTANQTVPAYSLVPPPTPAPGAQTWIGPFEVCKPGQAGTLLELDFVFASGLFTMDGSGNLQQATVVVQVEAWAIDDTGATIGSTATAAWNETFTASSNTAQRFTRTRTLPLGRYRVRVARLNASDGKASTSDHVVWSGLKFQLTPPPAGAVVYGDVTLVALKLKATNGVSSSAAGSIRFRVTRRLSPLGDGTTPVATVNPADSFCDIVLAKYGGNRPRTADELDLDALAAARAAWAGANGFNAVFDQTSTVWEALALSVQCVNAAPLPIGSRMSLVYDGPQPVPTQLFTDANIAAGTLTVTDSFDTDGTPTGVRATYRDPRTFSEAALLLPAGAPDYLTMNLWGCTSETVARQLATVAANKRRLQRSQIAFTTELEGLSCLPGDRIGVAAGMMAWAQGARVEAVAGRTLTLDRALVWTSGATHAVRLRDPEGVPATVVGVTRGAADNVVVLPSDPPFALQGFDSSMEPTQLSFGVAGDEVTDWTVVKMTPAGSSAVAIEAVNYDAAVWAGGAAHQQRAIGG